MRVLIFNSGTGSRMGSLTDNNPKCLVRLANGESILHRQLRLLVDNGLRHFVITTGPWAGLIEAECCEFEARGFTIRFVPNVDYARTNYLHSMWLAQDEIRGHELIMLHGDLVFDGSYVSELLSLPAGSYGSVDPTLPVPSKDFAADIDERGLVHRVGVGITGANLQAFQALYRLDPAAVDIWLDSVAAFELRGETGVYAENAANEVFERMGVRAHPYTGHVVEEVDTPEDLARVSEAIQVRDYSQQPVLELRDGRNKCISGHTTPKLEAAQDLTSLLHSVGISHPLVVVDGYFAGGYVQSLFDESVRYCQFSGFSPNPTYEQVCEGIRAFHDGGCDAVVSLGGGSAIDVAKCIKQWKDTEDCAIDRLSHDKTSRYNGMLHVAIPTTAGTGSESTHFAVLYVDGIKTSVAHPCLQPDVAVLDSTVLADLPRYQKCATLLDALSHAIESWWARKASSKSRAYAHDAIAGIVGCVDDYLAGDASAASRAMRAANNAGKAINLANTTAAHAMSYKLTSLYGIAHGHAVALCLPFAWRTLLLRGDSVVQGHLRDIAIAICGCENASPVDGLSKFEDLIQRLDMMPTFSGEVGDLEDLVASVNTERLSNFPLELTDDELRDGYRSILRV